MPAVMERPRQQALYELWPRQQRAMWLLGLAEPRIERPVEELLYGGAAGGGKSHLLRAMGVTYCWNHPNAVVALFRRTYPELEETHIRAIQHEVPQAVAKYVSDRHELRFPNGAVLAFRYCEREDDVFRYQGAEWEALLLDEATHFSGTQVAYLRTRVRSTRPDWRPTVVYATNPGNVGHGYFKSGFVDAAPMGEPFRAPESDGGLWRCFLQSKLDENPSLPADYARQLEGIPDEAMRRALRDGDWDVFVGQFFQEWKREAHTVADFPLPAHWTERGLSVDFGYGAPFSCHFWVRDEDAWTSGKVERWYAYREMYGPNLRDDEQAKLIKAAMDRDEQAHKEAQFMRKGQDQPVSGPLRWAKVGDPAMWNNKPMSNHSVATVYQQQGVTLGKANNDRVNGWQRFRAFLAPQADGKPGVVFFRDACPNAIRTIPSLVYDKHRPEDLDTTAEDHAADEVRYWLMSRGDPRLALIGQRAPLHIPTGGKDKAPVTNPRMTSGGVELMLPEWKD